MRSIWSKRVSGSKPSSGEKRRSMRSVTRRRSSARLRERARTTSRVLTPPSGITKAVAWRRSGETRTSETVIEASGDLGARPLQTFRRVTLPLAFPGVVAGSIFTFSLTLGDYIIPSIIGNSAYFIGSVVLVQQGTAGNLPMAAAFTVVPMLIMGVYLLIARRLGAFDAL